MTRLEIILAVTIVLLAFMSAVWTYNTLLQPAAKPPSGPADALAGALVLWLIALVMAVVCFLLSAGAVWTISIIF